MSRHRRLIATSAALLVVLAVGIVWFARQSGDGLSLETSQGITFLRNRADAVADDVAHPGQFSVGDDGCLYVTLDGGGTYLVALGPRATVTPNGIELAWGDVEFDAPATFGRASVEGTVPTAAKTECTGAEEVYGVA